MVRLWITFGAFHTAQASANAFVNNTPYCLGVRPSTTWGIFHAPPNYYGTTDSAAVESAILDFFEDSNTPVVMGDSALVVPPLQCHGIVWKIELNGLNPQEDQFDPIGSETIRFDVCFNRPMDIEYAPFVTFGVRQPFTQHIVVDSASWSPDSTIWTAYHTVGLETGDGINTIRVANARDDEHFEIPIEYTRFKFVIQAAGAASNQFLASAGVGKVDLEWPTPGTVDALGINMYRFQNVTDSTFSDTMRINTELVADTTYTDFAVTPETAYHYLYRILGTDMVESDFSKSVTATPVNASGGDANGDLVVNILDVVAIVNYVLEEDPQPFLLEAADVNADGEVNVLDIVATVNIILGVGPAKEISAQLVADVESGNREIAGELWETTDGSLHVHSAVPLGGVQLLLTGAEAGKCHVVAGPGAAGMEIAQSQVDDDLVVVLYSLGGGVIGAGEQQLMRIEGGSDVRCEKATGSDPMGREVRLATVGSVRRAIPQRFELSSVYPNPFNSSVCIEYGLPHVANVCVEVYNVLGQQIWRELSAAQPPGCHTAMWAGRDAGGRPVGTGVYVVRVRAGEDALTRKVMLLQ